MNNLFFVSPKLIGGLARVETLFILLLGISFLAIHRGRTRLARRYLDRHAHCCRPADWRLGARSSEGTLSGRTQADGLECNYPAWGAEDIDPSIRWRQPNETAAGDRYLAALSLAQRFPRAELLCRWQRPPDGGGVSQASIARAIFRNAGIAAARLRLDDASRNTAENAARSRLSVLD